LWEAEKSCYADASMTKSKKPLLHGDVDLEEGQTVPDVELVQTDGSTQRLRDFRGQTVVLFFYPKDSTPGCTVENQDFSRLAKQFEKANCVVLGVSRDSLKSHENFRAKYKLKVNLVSDGEESVCNAFSVIKMKNMYGKKVRGIERSTFVIDPDGKIRKIWRKVKVDGHADEVLKFVRGDSA